MIDIRTDNRMQQDFSLPPGAIGRFAVVKLWPEIKTAEDECIARLKIAAKALGIECVEVHADGGLLSTPSSTAFSCAATLYALAGTGSRFSAGGTRVRRVLVVSGV